MKKREKTSRGIKKRGKAIALTIIAIAVLIVGAITFFIVIKINKSSKYSDFYDGAEKAVKQKLIDPDSSRIRNISVMTDGYCGEANSKNQFGIYSEYRRFYVRKDKNGKWLAEFEKDRVIPACGP